MEKVIVSNDEIARVEIAPAVAGEEARLPPAIAIWQRIILLLVTACLPLLCLVSLGIRIAFRNKAPRTKDAWVGFCCTLLIISGLASSIAVPSIFLISRPDVWEPPGTFSIDAISSFPSLPSRYTLSTVQLVAELKPLVCIVAKSPFGSHISRRQLSFLPFGTAELLAADADGLLFVTSRHVIDGENWRAARPYTGRVALFGEEGGYAWAEVVGRHKDADAALLWTPRKNGRSQFVQPVLPFDKVDVGENIVTMGHPEGLFFSVSGGLVSRKQRDGQFQITAPVSPGASGGPVYDEQGRLLGIVTAMLDKEQNPDSENLNFATRADVLDNSDGWLFEEQGEAYLKRFQSQQPKGVFAPVPVQPAQQNPQ